MPPSRNLDPGASLLAFFGAELRQARMAVGLSQDQLGQMISYSGALVGRIETGERVPRLDLAERCDEAFSTGGLFARLCEAVREQVRAYPSWFREFVELEREATSIREFEALAVPGLCQTEDYARALFRAGRPGDSDDEIDQHVVARMDRQRILDRSKPPMLWAVLDEAVLRRPVGGYKIMYDQLVQLVRIARRPRVVLQVVPFSAGAHAGLLGPFIVLTVGKGAEIAYTKSHIRSPPRARN